MIRLGLPKGTQIAYVHDNAKSVHDKDVEYGFIQRAATVPEDGYFCRFWHRNLKTLRTVGNAELVPLRNLQEHVSVAQIKVTEAFLAMDM
jgi:hypothetical protein